MLPAELRSLLDRRVLLLDGGLGSMLLAAGLSGGRAPEWWNLEHPDRVGEVHRAYADAGSDIVHCNTFGAHPMRLAEAGLAGRVGEVCSTAVELARRACGGRALIAGDVGPTGQMLPPVGAASREEMRAGFEEQVAALATAGADLLSIETMSDLREALAATEAAVATGLAVLASMTFDVRPRGVFTIMGDPLVPSLTALAEAGAVAVGCNCSLTSTAMAPVVAEAAAALEVPVIAQPNAGQPRVTVEGIVYDTDSGRFVRDLTRMVEGGARMVGGCCGTTPAFIAAARAALP